MAAKKTANAHSSAPRSPLSTASPDTAPGAQGGSAASLLERARPTAEPVLLTGVQAVARWLAEQHLRDRRENLRTRSFVSGYPGSPLAGLDQVLARTPELAREYGVRLQPGVNEELAATAVWGSQLARPGWRSGIDGVVGVWFGKSPGLDRAGDAIRHANMLGVHPRGGVLAIVGDDPAAKSSTLPSTSERTLAALGMPVFAVRDAADLVSACLYGVALSRTSGHWVGVKTVADVADGVWSVARDFGDLRINLPELEWDGRPWQYRQFTRAWPPDNLQAEQSLVGPRARMVEAFAAANPVDAVEGATGSAWLGIVAAGKTYDDVRQVLKDLRVEPEQAGIRLLKLGLITPLCGDRVRAFARDLPTVLVVEEKGPFVETQLRDLLYGSSTAPEILGGSDAKRTPLVPRDGELTATRLKPVLHRVLHRRLDLPALPRPRAQLPLLPAGRAPYFCSGCPHNRSTAIPEGSLAGGGIGCHGMTMLMPHLAERMTALTQMGGEGAQWIGAAAFTDTQHLFQNMGDGTYFHSGQLAVQACVAAGVNITFKILYNSAVAMTGGQDATGAVDVATLTHKLHADGVCKIIVCADDPRKYPRRSAFAPGVAVWSRDRLDDAQQRLRATPGVTALIYDQRCAAESRRLRKRGALPQPRTRVVINERVCEGCGDCGAKSNCLSVQPVDTEFGRKTRIDQHSCNSDYSCLDGDCPSFVTLEAVPGRTPRRRPPRPPEVPDPPARAADDCDVVLVGVGGTGIVTVNQVLAAAAAASDLPAHGLDQTGLSQKAGPVVSHLRLSGTGGVVNRVGAGQADCYLAFDPLAAADTRYLAMTDPDRTAAFLSTSRVPTGRMVQDPGATFPDPELLVERISGSTSTCLAIDTLGAATTLFGDTLTANFLLVGAACQAGALPLSPAAIEGAIAANGVAIDANIAAFRWGRAAVADPDEFDRVTRAATPARQRYDLPASPLEGRVRAAVEFRAAELTLHSGRRAAADYVGLVERAWRAAGELGADDEFSFAVARGLFHLWAYKDEYEVARLLMDREFLAGLATEFPEARRIRYRIHPPILRALGLRRKIALGPMWRPVLKLLAHGHRLRGHWYDPFGHTRVRRAERSVLRDYITMVRRLVDELTADNYPVAVQLASAAELVRGYEEIKLANIDRYHEHQRRLLAGGTSAARP